MQNLELAKLALAHLRYTYIDYTAEARATGHNEMQALWAWRDSIVAYAAVVSKAMNELEALLRLQLPHEQFQEALMKLTGGSSEAAEALDKQIEERTQLYRLGEEFTSHEPTT